MNDRPAIDPMPDVPISEDLRATSDRMLEMIEELRRIETEKRHHPIGSPEFVSLASQAENLSRIVFRWSQMQGARAEDSFARGDGPSIADVPRRSIHELLANWREAELRLLASKPGSPESEQATNDVERYREEYRALAERQRTGADGS